MTRTAWNRNTEWHAPPRKCHTLAVWTCITFSFILCVWIEYFCLWTGHYWTWYCSWIWEYSAFKRHTAECRVISTYSSMLLINVLLNSDFTWSNTWLAQGLCVCSSEKLWVNTWLFLQTMVMSMLPQCTHDLPCPRKAAQTRKQCKFGQRAELSLAEVSKAGSLPWTIISRSYPFSRQLGWKHLATTWRGSLT